MTTMKQSSTNYQNENFVNVNEVYATFFEEPYPARSAFEVAKLPKGGLVEIEVIAYMK